MALNAKKIKSESKFERPPALEAGTYPARLVQIISLGLQPQEPWKGEEKAPKHELWLTYELLDEFLKDEDGEDILDKPRWVSERIPLNALDSDLAKSTKRYYALDPKSQYEGDWSQLGGTPCMVTLTYSPSKKDKDVVYNNIHGVQTMRSKDADKAPELTNPCKIFDFDEPDMDIFLALPTWLQDLMKNSLEYGGSSLEKLVEGSDTGNRKQDDSKSTDETSSSDDDKEADTDDDW